MAPPMPIPVVDASRRILTGHPDLPWLLIQQACVNFCASVLLNLMVNNEKATVPEPDAARLLGDQLLVRNIPRCYVAARDLVTVLLGTPSLTLHLQGALHLGRRLQKVASVAAILAECRTLLPPPSRNSSLGSGKEPLASPVAWLLSDKGCTKSREADLVMTAARRLCDAEDVIPYDALLGVLRDAYTLAQGQLTQASSRTKLPMEPIVKDLMASRGLGRWREMLTDLMLVLGTAALVNRRRADRALRKVRGCTTHEVLSDIQIAAQQPHLIQMMDDLDLDLDLEDFKTGA